MDVRMDVRMDVTLDVTFYVTFYVTLYVVMDVRMDPAPCIYPASTLHLPETSLRGWISSYF